MSTWSASTTNTTTLHKRGTAMPLPPITAAFDLDDLDLLNDEDEDFCTIHPLSETTANSRANLPGLQSKLGSSMRSNASSSNKVPDWLNDNHHYHHRKTFPIKHQPSKLPSKRPGSKNSNKPEVTQHQGPPRNQIDLLDLQFRPENSSLEIVNHRKTQRLISTDLSEVVLQDSVPKHGVLHRQMSSGSMKSCKNNVNSRLHLSSDESVASKTRGMDHKRRWIKSKNRNNPEQSRTDSQSTLPLSDSRDR